MIKKFLQDKEKKVLANNYLSLLLLQAANYLLPLLILPFLVRILGTDKFGLVMFAQSLAVFLTVFVDFGFNLSGTREISLARDDRKKLSEIFNAIMIVKLFLIVIAFAILYIIVNIFTRFSIDKNIYLLSFGIVIGQALFPVWFFQGIEKMKFVTLVNISAKLIFTLLVFILIRSESDYIYVPVYNSLGFIIAGLLGFLLCFKYVNLTWPKYSLIKQLVYESSSLFVSNFATTLYTSSNVFILGLFTGNTIVGVYSSMEKLILAVKNVYVPLYQAMYPWLSKQTDITKVLKIKKMAPFVLASGIVITLIIIIFGKFILNIIYDDRLIESYSIIFRILSFIAIFSGLNMLYNALYLPAIKKYKLRMNIMVVGGIANLLISLFLVKLYGIYGTAISVTFTEFLLLLLGYHYFKKNSKF
ncbi:oligosaccharide flippase family protein [Winogradskyella schleiferi]|uniref:oligosaccharide flippase family protein n=1 Tax=Winogradskyella schleiferi TaxID=2686078 RepID=UPI0015BFAE7F|nr:oligosaccharide flippase family protein [Winogradskyella schleiferi]